MYSAFFGLNIGQQGLYTARTGLNVTNHNISNIETEGYSRQYHVQRAMDPMNNGVRGMIGTGSEVIDVRRHRDAYLDDKYWSMAGGVGEYEVKTNLMDQLEVVLNEPSDNGLSNFYNDIFISLETLSKNPSDSTSITSFVNNLNSFSNYINDMGTKLLDVQRDANYGVTNVVNDINHHAQQIALINHQISTIEVHGNTANDLRDERSRLVDSLSKIINVDAVTYKDQNGKEHFRVSIDGQLLVDDSAVNYLETRPRKVSNNPEDNPDMLDIFWKNGKELYIDTDNLTGTLKGYIDIRDGNNNANFKGTVNASTTANTLVLENVSRTDIKQKGELNIGGKLMHYNSFTYDDATGRMSFDLGFDASVNGQTASCKDAFGRDFSGAVSFDSDSQIRIANPGDSTLDERGVIQIDGNYYTYTSYSKDPVTHEITLNTAIPAGSVGARVRQGDTMEYKGVPHYIERMNEFIRTMAKTFNQINEKGRGGTGVPLFIYKGYTAGDPLSSDQDYEKMDCHNVIINPDVINDVSLVEHSELANNPDSDNSLTLEFMAIRHDKDIFEKGEPENYIESLIGEVGIDSKDCQQLHKGQENLLHLVNNRRLSVSGVEINEEVMNLMKYQQAYSVAAKIVSTMDEIYDITINRMGM